MKTAVVTDSTCYLPPELAEIDVSVVRLRVTIGSREAVDGVDVASGEVTKALRDKVKVTTSRPSPAEFVAAYRAAFDAGASSVVSVHLSASLSEIGRAHV